MNMFKKSFICREIKLFIPCRMRNAAREWLIVSFDTLNKNSTLICKGCCW
jgi:hypothetical protein